METKCVNMKMKNPLKLKGVRRILKRIIDNNNNHNHNNRIINLPNEVVEQILLRMELPPNSLLTLKTVCKEWKLLIESPQFIDSYHSQASNRNNNNNNNPMVSFVLTGQHVYTIEVHLREGYYSTKNCLTLPNDETKATLIGCCNGILCFHCKNGFLLYNPSTQDYSHKPIPPNGAKDVRDMVVYGFGYDCSTYDYKVVSLYWDDTKSSQAHVYSLNSLNRRSWKPLEDCLDDHLMCSSSAVHVVVDNALHWLVTADDNDNERAILILRFDLCSEKFSRIPWDSEMLLHHNNHNRGLDVLDGCLSVWFGRDNGVKEIWTMKKKEIIAGEYGWSKVSSIQTDVDRIKLITLSEDGRRLFLATHHWTFVRDITTLCWYDIETGMLLLEVEVPMEDFGDDWVRVRQVETSLQSTLTLPLNKLKQDYENQSR